MERKGVEGAQWEVGDYRRAAVVLAAEGAEDR
jgi:hypothetical protein